jgi:hypothetical protein
MPVETLVAAKPLSGKKVRVIKLAELNLNNHFLVLLLDVCLCFLVKEKRKSASLIL